MRVGALGVVLTVASLVGCAVDSLFAGLAGGESDDGGHTDSVGVGDDGSLDDDSSFGGTNGAGGTIGTTGGGGGLAGSAGTPSCAQPLASFDVGCDAVGTLRQYCAQGGCHNTAVAAGSLDLTPDDLFVARTLNVRARMGVLRSGGVCFPAATCPPLGSTLLIDSNDPQASFMLQKMEGFTPDSRIDVDAGCGPSMPMWASAATSGYTTAASACLESLFLSIASFGTPCTLPGQTPVIVPPPPCL